MSKNNHPKKDNKKVRIAVLDNAVLSSARRTAQFGEPIANLSLAADLQRVYKEAVPEGKYSGAHEVAINNIFHMLANIAVGKAGNIKNYVKGSEFFAVAAECGELS